jgi:hypothetical protein
MMLVFDGGRWALSSMPSDAVLSIHHEALKDV